MMFKVLPEGGLVLDNELPAEVRSRPFSILRFDLGGTILDPRLEDRPGYIPLRDGVEFHYPDHVAKILGWRPSSWTGKTKIADALQRKGRKLSEVSHITRGSYLQVPRTTNRQYVMDTGIAVLDDLQRAGDGLIRFNHRYEGDWRGRSQYQGVYEVWLEALKSELMGKGSAMDQITGVLHPYSGRAVASCDPTIPLDSVSLPAPMVLRWMKSEEFRDAYGLDEGSSMNRLRGKLTLISRWPTHDRSSILAMKMRTHKGTTIRMNPTLIAGIWGGDYDGDCIQAYMPITTGGMEAATKMTLEHVLGSRFTMIAKELRHATGKDRLPESPILAVAESRHLLNSHTTGDSISWRDMVDPTHEGILSNSMDPSSRNKLLRISKGLGVSEIMATMEDEPEVSTSSAVAGFRTIKQSVARFHGALNSAMSLAIARNGGIYGSIRNTNRSPDIDSCNSGLDVEDNNTENDLPTTLRHISTIKRILAGEGLSAKHGGSEGTDRRGELVQGLFYYPGRAGIRTRDEAEDILVRMCGLPEVEVGTLLDVMWSDPPVNINQQLKEIAPTYMLTRRGADMTLLDQWTGDDPTITSYFLGE